MNPDKLEIEYLRKAIDLKVKENDGLRQIIEQLLAQTRQLQAASAPADTANTAQ